MFAKPEYVFKDGEMVVKNGRIVAVTQGTTHVVRPDYDTGIERSLRRFFEQYHTVRMENFAVHDDEITDGGRGSITIQPHSRGDRP